MTVTLSDKGLSFLKDRTNPLAVNSMDDAAEAILRAIEKGPPPSITPEKWARHLAWIVGFDRLIDDRKELQRVVELLA